MEAVTKIDRAGRLMIPKEIRERMQLKEDSSLLISESNRGVLILKKLDIEEMARSFRQELKGVNVEGIAKRIEVESGVAPPFSIRFFALKVHTFLASSLFLIVK